MNLSGISSLVIAFPLSLVLWGFPTSSSGMTIIGESISTNYRFTSGFGTANPVANTSPSFLGHVYDLSSVGWSTVAGDGGRVKGMALISPVHIYDAAHYIFPVGGSVAFQSANGAIVNDSIFSGSAVSGLTDVAVNTMNRAITDTDGVSVLRILDISSGNYIGQSLLMMGSHTFASGPVFATAKIGTLGSTLTPTNKSFTALEPGDSGSPILLTYKGQVTIAGANLLSNGTGGTLLPTADYDPVTPVNAVLAADGYALRFTIYDMPSDGANTANVWTGGAGSSNFSTAGNWQKGVVPAGLPVVFDSGSAGSQASVNLASNQSLRGMLFRASGGSSGFTFTGPGTLSIGYSGIRNEDTKTQTFHTNIALTGSQNWEAVNGDLIFNGTINNNGYLPVVQGARNVTLSNIISGTGGLAKDGSGTLTLNAQNTYGGTTFIHDGVVRLGISNALPTGGTQERSVIFDAANPGATLDLNGHSQKVGDLRSIRGAAGTVAISGGSLNVGSLGYNSTYAGAFTGGGSVTKTGFGTWTLIGNSNNYSGTFVVSSGTLIVNNISGAATGTGTTLVESGAVLGGSGRLGGRLVMHGGSRLSPGVSGLGMLYAGAGLTWDGSAQLNFDLAAGNTADLLDLGAGFLQKGTAGTYSFLFNDAGGMAPGLYTLARFGGTNFTASDFSFLNTNISGTFLLTASSLQFQLDPSGTLSIVPEVNSLPLIAVAFLFLALRRRHRPNTFY